MGDFLAATENETNEGDRKYVNLSIRRELEREREGNEDVALLYLAHLHVA